jgi:hypothetical protein
MATRDHVLQVLRGTEASRIRFTIPAGGGLTIGPALFQRVAHSIENNRIHVTAVTTFPAGVGALYHPDTNTIDTPPLLGRTSEGLLLHECTHAAFDLLSVAIPAVADEAAAYVVDALYFRMTGLPRPRWNAQLHALAGNLADGLLRQYQQGTHGVPAVDSTMWVALGFFIMTHPVYIAGPAGHGGSYLHNG